MEGGQLLSSEHPHPLELEEMDLAKLLMRFWSCPRDLSSSGYAARHRSLTVLAWVLPLPVLALESLQEYRGHRRHG